MRIVRLMSRDGLRGAPESSSTIARDRSDAGPRRNSDAPKVITANPLRGETSGTVGRQSAFLMSQLRLTGVEDLNWFCFLLGTPHRHPGAGWDPRQLSTKPICVA